MLSVVILAAGKGKRMLSATPKVLFELAGKKMIDYSIDLAKKINADKIIIVVGSGSECVIEHIHSTYKDIFIAHQKDQLGTADAVKSALPLIDDKANVLILSGDMPLVDESSIRSFIKSAKSDVNFISAKLDNPKGYGRVIRSSIATVIKIVEDKDANEHEKEINEVNTGIYFISAKELKSRLKSVTNNNAQKEFYLTDIINAGSHAHLADDNKLFLGVNDRIQLADVAKLIWIKRAKDFMQNGVGIIDYSNCYIDDNVKIGKDTVIYPNVFIREGSLIGKNVIIRSGSVITASNILDNVEIKENCLIDNATVGKDSKIGPMAHLRPKTVLRGNNRVGNFVEIKKSDFGENSKASHLSYIGDASIGNSVNIGCGTITCNYDGYNKFETIIGDNVFIGSDVQFIAPVKVGNNVIVAAGSTITDDINSDDLAISRTKQINVKSKGKQIMDRNSSKVKNQRKKGK